MIQGHGPSLSLTANAPQTTACHDRTAVMNAARGVRKIPSWPRSWANFSLLQLYFHRNAWANFHLSGQPNTFLAGKIDVNDILAMLGVYNVNTSNCNCPGPLAAFKRP